MILADGGGVSVASNGWIEVFFEPATYVVCGVCWLPTIVAPLFVEVEERTMVVHGD